MGFDVRSTAKVTIVGSGFFPSSSVDIGGGVFGNVTTDPAGNFLTTVRAPHATIKPGARRFNVTASDENFDTGQKVTASTTGHYKWTVFFDNVKKFSKRAIPTYVYAFHKV